MSKSTFPGFPLEMLRFLNELSAHNNRSWFQANKSRYEEHLLEPSLAFIAAMVDPLAKISPHFRAVPKRMGGSLMRIYRDVRFAKDKRPYKTNVGIQFRHETGKDVHAPGFYFHIDPDEVFVGAGIWHPDSKTLGKIRKAIEQQTGLKTIPQIYVGGKHIGGATEMFDAAKDGSLADLLEANQVTWNRSVSTDPYSFLPGWLHTR